MEGLQLLGNALSVGFPQTRGGGIDVAFLTALGVKESNEPQLWEFDCPFVVGADRY